ncbi:hypothetical protein Tco_0249506, partial [Tanacetum coccineum]
IALDDALVAPADRLKIGKFNLRLSSDVTSKEATLQAFQVTADAPEIYMQEFWASAYVHNRSVRFKMNNKKHILGLEQFRDILQICPKVGTIPPKTKGSKKKANTEAIPITTKQKPPTAPKEKKEKKSGKGKQKTTELETISEAVLT